MKAASCGSASCQPGQQVVRATKDGSTTRDRRHDTDLVALLHRRFLVLQKANVLAVDIDIHEAAQVALRIEQALADAGDASCRARRAAR